MEIRKADSKGRVTGFEPGALYTVIRGHTGTGIALNQLILDLDPGVDVEKFIIDTVGRDRIEGGVIN